MMSNIILLPLAEPDKSRTNSVADCINNNQFSIHQSSAGKPGEKFENEMNTMINPDILIFFLKIND